MNRVIQGDCREVMATLDADSVDAIVSDPPYGLSFMGKGWDHSVPGVEFWEAALRVAKPGAHLLAFGGTRLFHRLACAIEDAGWEIRDTIMWVYAQGFPKSHNGDWGGTALKPSYEPIIMARKPLIGTVAANFERHGTGGLNIDGCRVGGEPSPSAAMRKSGRVPSSCKPGEYGNTIQNRITPEQWMKERPGEQNGRWPANLIHDGSDEAVAGMGDCGSASRFFQCCKVCYNEAWLDLNLPPENVSSADQSLSRQRQSAVSALVLAVSEACPEGLRCNSLSMEPSTSATGSELSKIANAAIETIQSIGQRFWQGPKQGALTLSLDHARVAVEKTPTGTTTITINHWKSDGSAAPVTFSITPKNLEHGARDCPSDSDSRRFIYCAKASKADRDEGLDGMPLVKAGAMSGVETRPDRPTNHPLRANHHPTVKPTDLMAYLCRLVTPKGGLILDPFCGSGSTGKAAVREGFNFIGIELDPEYCEIARARIEAEASKAELYA